MERFDIEPLHIVWESFFPDNRWDYLPAMWSDFSHAETDRRTTWKINIKNDVNLCFT